MRRLVLALVLGAAAAAAPSSAATRAVEEEGRFEAMPGDPSSHSIGALAADAHGRLFALDVPARTVVAFEAATGRRLAEWRVAVSGFGPSGALAAAPDGEVFVLDYDGRTVTRYSPDGAALGSLEPGALSAPTGLTFDAASGRLGVADTGGLRWFDRGGRAVGARPGGGAAMVLDSRGRLWAHGAEGGVFGWGRRGRLLQSLEAGLAGQDGDGVTGSTTGLALTSADELVTANPETSRLGIHDRRGTLRAVCPLPFARGTVAAMAGDRAGRLYVTDGFTVFRLAERDRAAGRCRAPALRLGAVATRLSSSRRSVVVRYRLDRPADLVVARLQREVRVRCPGGGPRRCRELTDDLVAYEMPGTAGLHHVLLRGRAIRRRRGLYRLFVIASSRDGDRAFAPVLSVRLS